MNIVHLEKRLFRRLKINCFLFKNYAYLEKSFYIVKVNKKTLLLIACIVWFIAGFNILRIGILSYPPYLSIINILLSIVFFSVFQHFIFGRLVKKHTV